MKRITFTFLLACCSTFFAHAQCTSDEVEVSILVETDAYGYEIFYFKHTFREYLELIGRTFKHYIYDFFKDEYKNKQKKKKLRHPP